MKYIFIIISYIPLGIYQLLYFTWHLRFDKYPYAEAKEPIWDTYAY